MRRSASTAPEHETSLNALLLIGSIRLFCDHMFLRKSDRALSKLTPF